MIKFVPFYPKSIPAKFQKDLSCCMDKQAYMDRQIDRRKQVMTIPLRHSGLRGKNQENNGTEKIGLVNTSQKKLLEHQGPLLLTWFNFNHCMDM